MSRDRQQTRELVAEIVSHALPRKEASEMINARAAQMPETDRARFIEVVETELLSLHEGNFVRYWIRPAEFKKWKEVWKK